MTNPRTGFAGAYLRFVGLALLTAGLMAAIGYAIVVKWVGSEAIGSMAVGCAISFVASCIGALPIALALTKGSSQAANAVLGSTAIRFIVVLGLVAPAVLSGWFERKVLVISVVVSYLLMLVIDTLYAVRAVNRLPESS